jgi:hypothetical protein
VRSTELADAVEELIRECRERVMGVGDQQYSEGDQQKFEGMPLTELFEWAFEEIDDVVVYAAMIRIRLQRVKAMWDAL